MKITVFALFYFIVTALAASPKTSPIVSSSDLSPVSYTANILHKDPKNPDLTAQSSINVNFNLKPTFPEKVDHGFLHHLVPKTIGNYKQPLQSLQYPQTQSYAPSFKKVNADGDSQSFNVGYSMSFGGKQKQQQQQPGADLGPLRALAAIGVSAAGDIITGTRKGQELVEKPKFPKAEFLSGLFDLKKQKVSAAKQAIKFDFPDLFQQTKPSSPSAQDNLTPLTQGYFANLPKQQTSQIQYPQVHGFQSSDLPPITQNVQPQSWKTLSPSVEIFKSGGGNYQANPQQVYQQAQQFDHKGALGQSLGFDYSNAIDFGNGNGQRETPQHSSGPVLFDGKQQPQQQPQHNFGVPSAHGFQDPSFFQFPQLQTSASDPEGQIVGNKQFQGKLPVDTRLLRNPVLITEDTSLSQEKDVVPIRYDTHLLKEALNHQQPIQQPPLQQQSDYFGGNDGFRALAGETFKHYGKPQQENLLGGYKDKAQDYLLRQPRVGPKKRSEVGLETHLRPPPVSGEYQIKPFNSKI